MSFSRAIKFKIIFLCVWSKRLEEFLLCFFCGFMLAIIIIIIRLLLSPLSVSLCVCGEHAYKFRFWYFYFSRCWNCWKFVLMNCRMKIETLVIIENKLIAYSSLVISIIKDWVDKSFRPIKWITECLST